MPINIKKLIEEIDEKLSHSEYWEKQEKERERNRWKNEDRFNNFLKFLIDLNKSEGRIISDMYDYKEEKLKGYELEEFHILFESLEHAVRDYATENFIEDRYGVDEESYFTESSIVLKVNNEFYQLELVVGQGSYIIFDKVEDFKPKKSNYVDYELMLKNKKNPHYEETIKDLIHEDLNDMKDKIREYNVNEELFIEALKEYISNEETNNDSKSR